MGFTKKLFRMVGVGNVVCAELNSRVVGSGVVEQWSSRAAVEQVRFRLS
jgi:hypothetical protein